MCLQSFQILILKQLSKSVPSHFFHTRYNISFSTIQKVELGGWRFVFLLTLKDMRKQMLQALEERTQKKIPARD